MDEPTIVAPPNNKPYLWAIGTMLTLTLTATILIVRGRKVDAETLQIVVLIFAFLSTTTLSLLTFMKAQETHLSVNSRLDAFMRHSREAALAEGAERGRAEERLRALAETDAAAKTLAAALTTEREKHTALLADQAAHATGQVASRSTDQGSR